MEEVAGGELSRAVESALRHLHEFISRPEFAEEVKQGQEEFFRLVTAPLRGESIEELRLASFVEWFIFDRQSPGNGRTPVEEYLRRRAEELSGDELEVLRGFARTVHSVFQVKGRKEDTDLLDLYSGMKYTGVKRVPMTLGQGDIAELRLAPAGGLWFATDALCFHPFFARQPIVKMLKAARKQGEPLEPCLIQLMAMNTRFERYPKTAKRSAYDPSGVAKLSRP